MWHPSMPVEIFKFLPRELNRWADGNHRVLRPGQDFPDGFDLREIKKRLGAAARKRDMDISVWFLDGNVHFMITPWTPYRGINP